MQIPFLVIAVAAEVYLVLLLATAALIWHSRRQKNLLQRQQQKLLETLQELEQAAPNPVPAPSKSYKHFINEALAFTEAQFNGLCPGAEISNTPITDGSPEQQIISLRYAFLRAEELSTTEAPGSHAYWQLLQQSLTPLLPSYAPGGNTEELETYKKRVENLEKFKKLFFDLEEQWKNAQNTAQDYYAQLNQLGMELSDNERFNSLLDDYHNTFLGLDHHFLHTSQSLGEPKTIKVIRQDPRAAEEIIKLRNVAADQYRIINNLQRKLEEAQSDHEKAMIVQELEQQLQRQIRFVQESDTCIQLLEEELATANEKIAKQEHQLELDQQINEENERIKQTLEHFTLESKDLVANLGELEEENRTLKTNLEQIGNHTPPPGNTAGNTNLEQLQAEFINLQKQYADLEEKYLELKFK